ncbi:MAG: CDP-alcohol phosphatidyltransferase family protein [Proteobacteria bacterium]|nr:CDP-alcohol phosphatidyltransferase family protein [Pseudomonadota bacterium]
MSKTDDLLASNTALPELIVVGECNVQLWSLSASERHERAFARHGIRAPSDRDRIAHETIIAVRADYLLSGDLVAAICKRANTLLTDPEHKVVVAIHAPATFQDQAVKLLQQSDFSPQQDVIADLEVLGPIELGTRYDNVLRKRATPFALPYSTTSIDELEQKTFGAAYKGATDFVTKWCWPRPARVATRWAAAHGISPNAITSASLVLVLVATWMFAQAYFLLALPIAWGMTFLDTVDGKLARVTMTSSAWGNIYDHGIDLIHPPFWWWAWYVGVLPFATAGVEKLLLPALWIILAGYLAGRLLEGVFVLAFKIETHIWQPLDFFFRTITARRNPNLAILTIATLLGSPDIGFIAVAAWTLISLLFHAVRLAQAGWLRLRGEPIVSWLIEE